MSTLYEISAEIDALIDEAIDTETGEIRSETLNAELDQLEGKLEDKVLNIACVIVDLDGEAEKIAARAKSLTARAQTLRNKTIWLRRYITDHVEVGFKAKDDRVALAVTPGVEHVNVTSIDALPEQYKHTMVVPVKLELARVLKAGGVVSGAELERGLPSVRIR